VEDLSCQELVELVTEYLEGALAPGERARFDAHLAQCDGCTIHLARMRITIRLVGATAGLDERPALSTLLGAFRLWHQSR